MEKKNKIFGLDIFRCTAILLVLLAHTFTLTPFSDRIKYLVMFYFGNLGVEIFFVLSGYLVGKIFLELIDGQSFSLRTVKYFWIRRWLRTLPAYYLALAIYVAQFYFSTKHFILAEHGYTRFLYFFQNFITPHPGFFIVAWSLSVEEWFYLLMPLWFMLFFWLSGRNKKILVSAIIMMIVAVNIIRVFYTLRFHPAWDEGIRRMVPFRLDSLMVGVLMGYFHLYRKTIWQQYARVLFITGICITLFTSAWLYFDVLEKPDHEGFFSRTFLFTLFSLGFACLLPVMSEISKPFNWVAGKTVSHISLISYSLYLIHPLVIFIVQAAFDRYGHHQPGYLKFLSAFIFSVAAATLMYRFFERPIMKWRDKIKR